MTIIYVDYTKYDVRRAYHFGNLPVCVIFSASNSVSGKLIIPRQSYLFETTYDSMGLLLYPGSMPKIFRTCFQHFLLSPPFEYEKMLHNLIVLFDFNKNKSNRSSTVW